VHVSSRTSDHDKVFSISLSCLSISRTSAVETIEIVTLRVQDGKGRCTRQGSTFLNFLNRHDLFRCRIAPHSPGCGFVGRDPPRLLWAGLDMQHLDTDMVAGSAKRVLPLVLSLSTTLPHLAVLLACLPACCLLACLPACLLACLPASLPWACSRQVPSSRRSCSYCYRGCCRHCGYGRLPGGIEQQR